MKVGIYTNNLEDIKFLKTLATELPYYDYELYIETRPAKDTQKIAEEGLVNLIQKNSELIIDLTDTNLEKINLTKSAKIIKVVDLIDFKNYLENNPEVEKTLSRNQYRNIFLTENTADTDKTLEHLLGGTLIRE
jgi:hypothetical protein